MSPLMQVHIPIKRVHCSQASYSPAIAALNSAENRQNQAFTDPYRIPAAVVFHISQQCITPSPHRKCVGETPYGETRAIRETRNIYLESNLARSQLFLFFFFLGRILSSCQEKVEGNKISHCAFSSPYELIW